MTPPPPQGGACMNPRGTVGRIYKEDHYTVLLTKYESSGPCGFGEEDFFYVFPIVSLWELMTPGAGPFLTPGARLAGFIKRNTIYCYKQNMKALGLVVSEKIFVCFTHDTPPPPPPQGGACMNPRGTVGRIYKEDHYTVLLTKYESSGPCGFGEEDFFMFCPTTPLGRGLYGPQGHGWQDL